MPCSFAKTRISWFSAARISLAPQTPNRFWANPAKHSMYVHVNQQKPTENRLPKFRSKRKRPALLLLELGQKYHSRNWCQPRLYTFGPKDLFEHLFSDGQATVGFGTTNSSHIAFIQSDLKRVGETIGEIIGLKMTPNIPKRFGGWMNIDEYCMSLVKFTMKRPRPGPWCASTCSCRKWHAYTERACRLPGRYPLHRSKRYLTMASQVPRFSAALERYRLKDARSDEKKRQAMAKVTTLQGIRNAPAPKTSSWNMRISRGWISLSAWVAAMFGANPGANQEREETGGHDDWKRFIVPYSKTMKSMLFENALVSACFFAWKSSISQNPLESAGFYLAQVQRLLASCSRSSKRIVEGEAEPAPELAKQRSKPFNLADWIWLSISKVKAELEGHCMPLLLERIELQHNILDGLQCPVPSRFPKVSAQLPRSIQCFTWWRLKGTRCCLAEVFG